MPCLVTQRPAARDDVAGAVDWYAQRAGLELALRFVESVHAAFKHIAHHPDSGSPRYASSFGAPDLRFWPLRGFPYLVFYQDRGDWLDAWRVLHAERDIPASLREES